MSLDKKLIGGRAAFDGIYFFADYGYVRCRENEQGYELLKYKYESPKADKYQKVPIVRSIIKLISIFRMFAGTLKQKYKVVLGVFSFFLIMSDIHVLMNPEFYASHSIVSPFALVVFLIILLFFRKKLIKLFQYHGAEHKAVNAVKNGEEINFENVEKQSRVSSRCGTTLITFYVPLVVAISYFSGVTTLIGVLVALVLSIELFLLAQSHKFFHFIFTPFLKMSKILQKYIITQEPTHIQVKAATKSIKALDDIWGND